MNYIWEIPIKAKEQQIDLKKIKFSFDNDFSPYLEINNQFLNEEKLATEIGVNPYYRFFDIFKGLFLSDYLKYMELRTVWFDILNHFLAAIDIYQGMDQAEFYKKFIKRDIKNTLLGEKVKEGLDYFTLKETNILLDSIYKFYNLGEHLFFLELTVKRIFNRIIMYLKQENKNQVLLFINQPATENNIKKLEIIKEIFLPINFELEVYWKEHFGIIGVSETMGIGKISVYQEGSL